MYMGISRKFCDFFIFQKRSNLVKFTLETNKIPNFLGPQMVKT